MEYKVCCVFDKVASTYSAPQIHLTEEEAIRSFDSAVRQCTAQRQGLLFTNKDDFELWLITNFDSEAGYFNYASEPIERKLLIKGSDIRAEI